jgi:hypothetical protein
MRSETANVIKKVALVVGELTAAITLLLSATDVPFLALIAFVFWVTSPYLVMIVVSRLVERFTEVPGRYTVGCVVALLMLAFSLMTYIGTFGDKSSTYGLIFLFIPLWLHIGGVGLYSMCILISWLTKWSQRQA